MARNLDLASPGERSPMFVIEFSEPARVVEEGVPTLWNVAVI